MEEMKKLAVRFWYVVLIVGMFPVTFLLPVWGLIYIFTGRFYMLAYYDYVEETVFDS